MKKSLIAIAVAGVMAAPLAAQAELSVSGKLQSQIVSYSGDRTNEGLYVSDGSASNGNNRGGIFLNASEDLGNGLTAVAKYGFKVDNSTTIGTRDAYVGLSGGFGTVLAGRMATPYKSSTVKWDPFVTTFMQARGNGGMSSGVTGHSSYLDNVLAYANKFGPVTFVAGVGFDEAAEVDPVDGPTGSTVGNHATTLSANIDLGAVEVALAMVDASEYGNVFAENHSATKLGVKWDSGAGLGVAFQYEMLGDGHSESTAVDPDTGDAETSSIVYLNGTYAMGANTFALALGQRASAASDTDAGSYMALGMLHDFSKTTRVHVGYRSTTDMDYNGDNDDDESAIGAGLRVAF